MRRATITAVRPHAINRSPVGTPGMILGGKYRLEVAIARGGMARVWRATHTTLNRPVAVKFVDPVGSTNEETIARFLREAKVAASVRHKNVVDIIDFGVTAAPSGSREGEPYMVMELLEGETLDQRLIRGTMSNDEVLEVALQLLSGLDAVHSVGIIHRDLKPGNVFLTADHDGVFARLLDFGISQDQLEAGESEKLVVGTPEYMSPEQAFGDPLDARSDLYSVGVMLYEMMTGVPPFEDPDPQKVVELVAHGTPPPIAQIRPDAPAITAVIERAMAREPADRFQSALAMRAALVDALGDVGGAPSGRHHRSSRDPRKISGPQARVDTQTISGAMQVPASTRSLETSLRSGSSGPWVGLGALTIVALVAVLAWTLTRAEGRRSRASTPAIEPAATSALAAPTSRQPESEVAADEGAGDDAVAEQGMPEGEPPSEAVPDAPTEAAPVPEEEEETASPVEPTLEPAEETPASPTPAALRARAAARARARTRRARASGSTEAAEPSGGTKIVRELDF